MSTKETPQHIGGRVDNLIDFLNIGWDLGLPRLHGQDADAAEEQDALARRCSARIRYLCFRVEDMSPLINDFEERAKHIYSKWVMKPSQEDGTLVNLPRTKSFLMRDNVDRKPTIRQRKELVQTLENVLKDPYDLARQSDSFQLQTRTAANNTIATAPIPAPVTRSQHAQAALESRPFTSPLTQPSRSPLKRARDHADTPTVTTPLPAMADTAKKQKKRPSTTNEESSKKKSIFTTRTIDNFFRPAETSSTTLIRSFDTTISNDPSDIFDTPANPSNPSSGDTSILDCADADADEDDSQKYFQTQDAMDIVQDESFQELSHIIESEPESWADVLRKAPLSTSIPLPENLPFVFWYELHRIAILWSLHPLNLYKEIRDTCKKAEFSYEEFWGAVSTLQKSSSVRVRPENCSVNAFAKLVSHDGSIPEDNKSVYLSGRLDWTKQIDKSLPKSRRQGVFSLQLKTPKIDRSCRFHNVYGGHRFLILEVPFIAESSLPKDRRDLREDATLVRNSIVDWLATQEHKIAGRLWRPFYVETDQAKSKDVMRYHKVHLFATKGAGIRRGTKGGPDFLAETSIHDFINWHAPLSPNYNSTDLKLFQRFKLGLSKTIATIELIENEFRHLPDAKPVMNDGCALMSFELGHEITKKLGLEAVPAAFQGRISGAKGLWVVDRRNSHPKPTTRGYWIEVSDSQLKIKPHPRKREREIPQVRTFEFSQCSDELSTAALNVQLLTILADRGVSRELVAKRLETDIKEYYDGLCNSMENPQSLCAWLQKYHRIVRDSDEITMLGSLPDEKLEKVLMLLQAGFEPKTCDYLTKLLYDCLNSRLKLYVDKLLIKIPLSTTAYCVADPYGVLEPDEVHFGFSRPWLNPETRSEHSHLHDIDVLVARNPALLPTDIQKRKAVFKHELADLRDVIVFPTKGNVPLASLLSGGDYDGDRCWVCWDEGVVKSFKGINSPPKLPSETACGLVQMSRKISSIVKGTKPTGAEINDFLTGCLAFNLQPTFLGPCTNQHEKLIYHTGTLNGEPARKLAALSGYLVDCAKQGFVLSEAAWFRIRKETCGSKPLSKPAYKEESEPKEWKRGNLVDYLKWGVAERVRVEMLKGFHNQWPRKITYLKELSKRYSDAKTRALEEKNTTGHSDLLEILDHLDKEIKAVGEHYALYAAKAQDDETRSFSHFVGNCHQMVRDIRPLDANNDISRYYQYEKETPYSSWNLLRASCMYSRFYKTSMSWQLAGKELCYLMAKTQPQPFMIIGSMYCIMKTDTKFVQRLRGNRDEYDDVDDVGEVNNQGSGAQMEDWIF